MAAAKRSCALASSPVLDPCADRPDRLLLLVRQLLRSASAWPRPCVAKEGDFRLLAEQSSDVRDARRARRAHPLRVAVMRSHGRLGPPPSCCGTLGARRRQCRGYDRGFEQAVAALKSRPDRGGAHHLSRRHRQKGEIWVETALRVTRSARQCHQIDGVVAISRDMTEHKDLEDKLAALATSRRPHRHRQPPPLRRPSRARNGRGRKRDGTPLSLLMVDVDHFKAVQRPVRSSGRRRLPACAVARVLAAHARRPGDLAARCGGEEFVLLMPGTEAEGCVLVGDEHPRGAARAGDPACPEPAVATASAASLGGSCNVPAGTLEPASLIEAADRALYAAKDLGRNRLVMSGQVIGMAGDRAARDDRARYRERYRPVVAGIAEFIASRCYRRLEHAFAPVRCSAIGRPAATQRHEQRRGVRQAGGFGLHAADRGVEIAPAAR